MFLLVPFPLIDFVVRATWSCHDEWRFEENITVDDDDGWMDGSGCGMWDDVTSLPSLYLYLIFLCYSPLLFLSVSCSYSCFCALRLCVLGV